MGAALPVMEESVDYLLKSVEKVGLIAVHLSPLEREALHCCAPEDGQKDRCS